MHQRSLSSGRFQPQLKIVDWADRLGRNAQNARLDGRDFVNTATLVSTYQVEAGRLALNRAQSLTVRDLARYMIGDHVYCMRKMQAATGNPMAELLDQEHLARLQALRETPGEKFDRTYLEQIRLADEEAINRLAFKPSLLKRIDTRLQELAGELTGLITRQLEMITGVQRRSQRLGIAPHYRADRV